MNVHLIKTVSCIKSYALVPIYRAAPILGGCVVQRHIAYGDDQAQQFDVYSTGKHGFRPVIMVVHGGGWVTGDKRERALFCTALAKQGYVVFSISYRLAPKHSFPAGMNDVSLALDWINKHAASYGGDANKLTVVGDSAGAHLASLAVASKMWRGRVKKLVLYYGVYNLRTLTGVSRPNATAYLRALISTTEVQQFQYVDEASPITFAEHFPPTLIIASEVDPLHQQSIELAGALKTAGISYKTKLFDKANFARARHGFQSLPNSKAGRAAFAAVIDFLAE